MDVKIPVGLQAVNLSDIAKIVSDDKKVYKEKVETENAESECTTVQPHNDSTTVTNNGTKTPSDKKRIDTPKLFYRTQVNGERKLVFVRPNVPVLSEKITTSKGPQQQITLDSSVMPPSMVSQGAQHSAITQTSVDTPVKTTKLVFSIKRDTESTIQKELHKSTLLPGMYATALIFSFLTTESCRNTSYFLTPSFETTFWHITAF